MRTIARTHALATFFVLAYSITCGAALLARLMVEDVIPASPLIPAMAGYAPSIAGVILMVCLYGSSGCRYFFSHLNPIRMGLRWPMFCVAAPPLILSLGVTLCLISAIGTPDQSPAPRWFTWPNLVTGTLWITFLGAGVGEELGWRGFALTHLQRKSSALQSSLLIGLAWGAWHLPAPVIMGTSSIASILSVETAAYLLAVIAMSVVLTVVFNSTKGSLVAVMLLHGANNASWAYLHDVLPDVEIDDRVENLIVGALWVVIAIACVFLFGSEHLSRSPREVIDFDAGTSESTAPVEQSPKQA